MVEIDRRFRDVASVIISMFVLWVVTSCELVARYQRFGRISCLHLQGFVTTQKTNIYIYTAVKTSNLVKK
jgi:hypothetical protein